MSGWSSWVTALRIARRETRRAKGRSALVVALIGLPILGLSFAAVTYDSFRLTPDQRLDREFGTAQASLRWASDGPVQQAPDGRGYISESSRTESATQAELLAALPAGSRVVRYDQQYLDLRTPAGVGGIEARGMDLADPIFTRLVELRDGATPAAADEVALTRPALDRLGTTLGGPVTTADGERTYTVTGIVEFPGSLREIVVFRPGAVPVEPHPHESQTWLLAAAAPVSWEQVQDLNQLGIVVRSRAVQLDPPPASAVSPEVAGWDDSSNVRPLAIGALIGGLAMLEVVLLAGPAFAVGARRRSRELALLAATGATPAHQRRIVLADGVVLGAIGAIVGIGLGVAAALASRPLLEAHLWQARIAEPRFFPLALVGIAGLAVLIGLAAALVPAVVAARQEVIAGLTGRRGVTRSRRRWLLLGLAMVAVGAVIAAAGAWRVSVPAVLAGLIIGELGLVLCTPMLIGLIARAGRWAPLTARIALRDTARNRAAAAPAISAVMAAVAFSLTIGIILTSDQARNQAEYLPSIPEGSAAVSYQWWPAEHSGPDPELLDPDQQGRVRAAVEQELAPERLYDVHAPVCPTNEPGLTCQISVTMPEENECPAWQISRELTQDEQRAMAADERCSYQSRYANLILAYTVVDDGTALPMLTHTSPEDLARATDMLAAGGVVVTNPMLLRDGEATLAVHRQQQANPDEDTERTLTVPGVAISTHGPELVVLSADVLAETGLSQQTVGLVAETATAPDQPALDAGTAAIKAVQPELSLYVEDGPDERSEPELLVLALAAGVVTLGAAAIGTGLAAADRRGDLSTLAAVGASPRVRRLLSLQQTGVIAGLGTALGLLAGVGAAFAVLVALNQRETTIWPSPDEYPLIVPWAELALLLAVPLVAMLGAGLFTRSRLAIERRPA